MGSIIVCALRQALLKWSNKGGYSGRRMYHIYKTKKNSNTHADKNKQTNEKEAKLINVI
jgi:hypothetical protein